MRTKDLIKAATANDAVRYSLEHGKQIQVGETLYAGKNPVYTYVGSGYQKVEKGIPFVRIN